MPPGWCLWLVTPSTSCASTAARRSIRTQASASERTPLLVRVSPTALPACWQQRTLQTGAAKWRTSWRALNWQCWRRWMTSSRSQSSSKKKSTFKGPFDVRLATAPHMTQGRQARQVGEPSATVTSRRNAGSDCDPAGARLARAGFAVSSPRSQACLGHRLQ